MGKVDVIKTRRRHDNNYNDYYHYSYLYCYFYYIVVTIIARFWNNETISFCSVAVAADGAVVKFDDTRTMYQKRVTELKTQTCDQRFHVFAQFFLSCSRHSRVFVFGHCRRHGTFLRRFCRRRRPLPRGLRRCRCRQAEKRFARGYRLAGHTRNQPVKGQRSGRTSTRPPSWQQWSLQKLLVGQSGCEQRRVYHDFSNTSTADFARKVIFQIRFRPFFRSMRC